MTMTAPLPAAGTPGRFDIGRVGRETFELIRSDPVGTYGLAAGLGAVPALLSVLLSATGMIAAGVTPGLAMGAGFGFGALLLLVGTLVVSVLIYGALGYGAVEQLQGRKAAIGRKLSAAGAALLPMIGVGVLGYLGIVIGTIFLIAPGLFLATLWSVSIVAAVVDRTGVFASFSRSAALTKNHRWMIFALIVVFFIIALIVGLVQAAVMRIAMFAGPVAVSLVAALLGVIVGGAVNAIGAVGVGVVYQELRRAKGEFDTGRLAEVFS